MRAARRLTARYSMIGVLVIAASCFQAGEANANVASELKVLANSREGMQVEARAKRHFIAGSGRRELASGLKKYRSELTGLQKGLIRLSLRISGPRYRKLRAALLRQRMTAKRVPELRGLLRDLRRNSALRLMMRKGEWLKHHPARLRSELSIYWTLARDGTNSPFDRKLAAILSRPRTTSVVRRLSPFRVISILTPQQVARTPPKRIGRTARSSSVVGDYCRAVGARAAGFFDVAYARITALLSGVGTAIVDLAAVYKGKPDAPFRPDIVAAVSTGALVGLVVGKSPVAVAVGAAEGFFQWWVQAAGTEALVNQVQLPSGGVQGQRIKRLGYRAKRDAHASAHASAGCGGDGSGNSPGNERGGDELGGGTGEPAPPPPTGEGPLHWTGEIDYADFGTYGTGTVHVEVAVTATWQIDAYTSLDGIDIGEGYVLPTYVLAASGEWKVYNKIEETSCSEPSEEPRVLFIEGSGSGSVPSGPYATPIEEYLKAPVIFDLVDSVLQQGDFGIRRNASPLGSRHTFGSWCFGTEMVDSYEPNVYFDSPDPYSLNNGRQVYGGFFGVCAPAIGLLVLKDGRTFGQAVPAQFPITGMEECTGASYQWDLTVKCPDGLPPVGDFSCDREQATEE
jgi:hypothetical protein